MTYQWTPTILIKADDMASAHWSMQKLRGALERASGELQATYGEFHGATTKTNIMDLRTTK